MDYKKIIKIKNDIQYVQILTLIIVFIFYWTSGHPNIILNFQTPISELLGTL